MKNHNHDQVIGLPLSSFTYGSVPDRMRICLHSPSYGSSQYKLRNVDSVFGWVSKFSKKADSYAQGIRDHGVIRYLPPKRIAHTLSTGAPVAQIYALSLGPKISETLKGKLSLGRRIFQAGGIEKVFRRSFLVTKGEKLLKAFQCYLSTTSGPIAGLLFISTEKIAFHSERSLTFNSSGGDLARSPYKVLIPLRRIKTANQSENSDQPNQKYIQIVTVDDYEFWFMGFLSYRGSLKCIKQATSETQVRVSR